MAAHSYLLSDLPSFSSLASPIERAQPPLVNQGGDEHADEYQHPGITDPPHFAERDSPGEDEDRLQVEDHKQHRDQIELSGETQPRRARRDDARFVWLTRRPGP